MALRPALAVAVALAALAATPDPAAAACATPDGAKEVEATEEAVVTVERHGDRSGDLFDESTAVWRGCEHGTSAQVVLLDGYRNFSAFQDASRFELAGPFAAFIAGRGTKYDGSTDRLVTVDLRDGTRWESGPVRVGFTGHAVNRRGAAAWVRRTRSRRGRARWRLFLRHEGRVEPVDSAPRPLTRLKLTTARLTWREGSRRRRRALP